MFRLIVRHNRRPQYSTRLFLLQPFSTSSPTPSLDIPLSHPTYLIWGSNTSVGKTLISTGLASSTLLCPSFAPSDFIYLKPIQTGFPADSDSRFLFHKLSSLSFRRTPHFPLSSSHHILKTSLAAAKSVLGREIGEEYEPGMYDLGLYDERRLGGEERNVGSRLICKTMFAWKEAISPHLAAEREGGAVKDSDVLELLKRCLDNVLGGEAGGEKRGALCVIETAGGVASPGPSGSLQCDLYR